MCRATLASGFVGLLLLVGAATACSEEPREPAPITRLREVAATLPIPTGTEVIGKDFMTNTPVFQDPLFSASLQYRTLSDVNLEDAVAGLVAEFESAGWKVTNLSTNWAYDNLAAHNGGFRFERDGEPGHAYLQYVIPPDIDTPMTKPAKVVITLSLEAP